MRLIQVAVPVPQLDALTYAVPAEFPDPVPGARVLVPLGRRVLTGIVVSAIAPGSGMRDPGSESADPLELDKPDPAPGTPDAGPRIPDPGTIKEIIDILDDSAFLPSDIVSLIAWVADYYACGAGEAMAAAMPPRAWIESERHARITDAGHARLLTERGARQLLEAPTWIKRSAWNDRVKGAGTGGSSDWSATASSR